jgi:hypothetical protein
VQKWRISTLDLGRSGSADVPGKECHIGGGRSGVPREYEQSNASIVLLGNFNPSIFSPAWFARYGLLTDEQVAAAEVTVVHPEVSIFTADWVEIRVENQRFQAQSSISPIQIRDLVLKTFVDYLPHTPIHSLGINRQAHHKLPSAEHRMRFGRALAPLAPWGEWGQEMEKSESPAGVLSLTMYQPRTDRPKGHLQITAQPSQRIARAFGVFFQVNDHYEVASRENLAGCEEIMQLLDKNFESSLERSDRILDQVLTEAEK